MSEHVFGGKTPVQETKKTSQDLDRLQKYVKKTQTPGKVILIYSLAN